MKTKAPPDRRKFADMWDEIGYLYDKLLYWLYSRQEIQRARAYAERLDRLLPKADPDHSAVFGEECRSLVHETTGDLRKAIEHRQNEIRLIHRLHDLSRGTPAEPIMEKDYDYSDLSDRLDLLAVLHHDSGQLEQAIATLRESKKLCETYGIPFDGEDLLEEYLEEKRTSQDRVA